MNNASIYQLSGTTTPACSVVLLFSFQQIFKHITILFLEGQVIGYLTRKLYLLLEDAFFTPPPKKIPLWCSVCSIL